MKACQMLTSALLFGLALTLSACDNQLSANTPTTRQAEGGPSPSVVNTSISDKSKEGATMNKSDAKNPADNACTTDPEASVCEIMSNLGATRQVAMSDEQWRDRLTEIQFYVTREGGTERAFTGEFWNYKGDGTFRCVCCDALLFDTKTKFDSGTGWPSFYAPADPATITEHVDRKYGMVRTEVRCARCDAHLGHVFPDGPRPTGLRYCINSASLRLDADGTDKPSPRPSEND
jgi:peptide-methionine (R)-S-oxide reductase